MRKRGFFWRAADSRFNLCRVSRRTIPLLVCFAVPEEATPFRKMIRRCEDVVVRVVGMGARNAQAGILEALADLDPARVITAGFAGGLNPAFQPGDVLFEADEGFEPPTGWEAGGAQPGRFHCADRVAVTPGEKAALFESTGADAVEMESGVIRRICGERGIPSATVRVISDAADESLPLDFNRLMKADMSMDFLKLAGCLLRSPGKVAELIRFRKQIGAAAEKLAAALKVQLDPVGRD